MMTVSLTAENRRTVEELVSLWPSLSASEQLQTFAALDDAEATDLFLALHTREQAEFLMAVAPPARRLWARLLAPDDAADVLQELEEEQRAAVLEALDGTTRAQVQGLLAFSADAAGGLMNPRYAVLRPELSTDQALAYLRRQEREREDAIYYVYVLDNEQRLVGVLSLRDLLRAPGDRKVGEVMRREVISVPSSMDQEEVAKLIARYDLLAVPVVDADGHMKGIVTIDDVVDVVNEEATEDIQKLGGTEALDAPYLNVSFWEMIRKRAGWLTVLFVGEMFTATAMAYFEDEISKAVVLALFIPLIISSGGNSGSQASTLIVRALGVGDVKLTDWKRVLVRELASGLVLGTILAVIGFARILVWPTRESLYGPHYMLIGASVAISLLGVVLWGTLSGSMLPFILRRLRFDPASASAPLVATLVDVTGLVIYFSVASTILRGTLL
jgi:magnesium transporter